MKMILLNSSKSTTGLCDNETKWSFCASGTKYFIVKFIIIILQQHNNFSIYTSYSHIYLNTNQSISFSHSYSSQWCLQLLSWKASRAALFFTLVQHAWQKWVSEPDWQGGKQSYSVKHSETSRIVNPDQNGKKYWMWSVKSVLKRAHFASQIPERVQKSS